MSTIVKLVQGSAEWHEHRRKYRNASETPIVLGQSPWTTPYQLWQHKLGLVEPEVTPAMLRGTQLEPAARAAYEARTGLVMQPLVVLDGEYSASLDGLTLGGERILEVKCPLTGRDSTLWATVEAGRLPGYYELQVQHQLMVTQAQIADVFVFDGSEGILFPVAPDPSTWPRIHAAWDEFAGYIKEAQAERSTRCSVLGLRRRNLNWCSWPATRRSKAEACQLLGSGKKGQLTTSVCQSSRGWTWSSTVAHRERTVG